MSLKVSQTFSSFQGEGSRTGNLAVWLRLFGCNLRCRGFSQPDPTNPITYINPLTIDPKDIKTLDEFLSVKYDSNSFQTSGTSIILRRCLNLGSIA